MNSRSGPSGPSPNRTSTADGLPPVAGGASGGGTSILPAASASRRSAEGGAEPPVRRLAPPAGRGAQVLQPPRALAAEPLAERLPQAHQAGGLGVVEAGRLDDLLELLAVGARVVRGRGVAREQRRGHH